MDTVKRRPGARRVAVVDSILVTIEAAAIGWYIVAAAIWGPFETALSILRGLGEASVYHQIEEESTSQNPGLTVEMFRSLINIYLWVILSIWVPFSLLQIVACQKLWVGCKSTCELKIAARNARFWRNVRTVFLLLTFVIVWNQPHEKNRRSAGITENWYWYRALFDFFGIGTVQAFIQQVDSVIDTEDTAEPNVIGMEV